jgi:hypothetical protein
MPSESIITIRDEIAKNAGGDGGATGQSTGNAGKLNPTKEGENKTEKKDKKSMLGSVGKVLTSVLGIQVTFAAMLRQSQLATGFLGAVFQVLGAILDSFLLAFAPQLFGIVEHLAKLIPVARAIGEEVALQVGNLWARIEAFAAWFTPVAIGIWENVVMVVEWFANLAPIWKQSLVALYVIPRLLAFMKVGFIKQIGLTMFGWIGKALTVHRAKSAAKGGAAKGAMSMVGMIPHARIIMIALAVVAVVGTALWAIFKPKKREDNAAGAIDISGQLGKQYLPSQASQLGGTLNQSMSELVQPFTDVVKPEMETFATTMVDTNPVVVAVAEEMAKLAEVVPIDEYGLMVNGMDSTINAQEEAQAAIVAATDNWVTDLSKNTKIQENDYGLMHIGQDSTIAALERQKKAIDEANTNWEVGSEQSKNQWMSTASFAHDAAKGASEKTLNFLEQSFSAEQMNKAMGGLSEYDANLAMINQDVKDLAAAAAAQKESAIAFQLMVGTVTTAFEDDRNRARLFHEEVRDAMGFEGTGDKSLDYLGNY